MEHPTHPSIPLTIFLTSLLSIALFHFMAFQTDSPSFVNAVELLLGKSSNPDRLFRLSKPLTLFLPAVLYYCLAVPITYGFFVQQLLFYWLTAYFLYKVLFYISNKKDIAYLSITAYLLCQPMAVYGLAILVDGMGWCWMVWGICLILNILTRLKSEGRGAATQATLGVGASHLSPATPKVSQESSKHELFSELQTKRKWLHLLGLGIFLGLGFFIKESIVLSGIFLFYGILLQKNTPWIVKIKAYFWVGISCLATFIFGSYLVYYCWNVSLFQWVAFNHDTPPAFSLKGFILQSYHTLDVYWFLIPFGLWQSRSLLKENYLVQSLLLTAITSWILLPFAWPYLYDRILFMNAPFLVLWIGMGAAYFGRWAVPIVVVGGLLNLLVSFGIYKYQIGGLIVGAVGVFLGVLLLAKIKNNF